MELDGLAAGVVEGADSEWVSWINGEKGNTDPRMESLSILAGREIVSEKPLIGL